MNWLFPLYLAGAAAIIAPILLHLRRQPPKDRVAFSSLMFLGETKRQPTRRRRLENWLLLLVRCLILLLLALMFARPYSRSSEAGAADTGEAVVVLVDRSASMRRADLWPRALAAARAVVDETGAGDRVAVGLFDSQVEWLGGGGSDQAGLEARRAAMAADLKAAAPGWSGTDLGAAMVAGLEMFGQWDDAVAAKRRMVVVSDFQEGAQISALQKRAWPQEVTVERRVLTVSESEAGNLTLELVSGRTESEDAGEDSKEAVRKGTGQVRRVRVSNARESQQSVFELAWEGGKEGAVVQGYLPPGGRRVVKMPPRQGGDETPGTLKLSGDAHEFDNRVYVTPLQPREVRVQVAAATAESLEAAASPGYYLKRALQPTSAIRPVMEAVPADAWAGAAAGGVLVCAGDGSRLGEAGLAAWRRALTAGGLGIYVVDGPGAVAELNALTEGLNWKVEEAERTSSDAYAMLGELDSRDVLLSPFADARLRDFTKVRFWKHRVVTVTAKDGSAEPEAVKILARFDNGDPALLAVRQGGGTLLLMTSGWHPADSQLALSTKFVPLWFGWLAAAGFSHEEEADVQVGQALPWRLKSDGSVTGPDGKEVAMPAGEAFIAREPGVYKVIEDGGGAEARWFAVQLPAGEGRVSVMAEERLLELGVKLESTAEDAAALAVVEMSEDARQRLDGVETESRQRLWLWTLFGILALVVAESLLGSLRSREPAVN